MLLLDIESGSVGSALALLARGTQPKVFGETRVHIPLGYHQGTAALMPQIERAAREALVHAAQVAAQLRVNLKFSNLGAVSRAAVFMSAPWGAPDLADGKQRFSTALQRSLAGEIDGYLGVGARFYTGADSAAFGIRRLMPNEQVLACVVRGETAELIQLGEGGVLGYATIPLGLNTVKRTLKSHGGMSEAEMISAINLSAHPNSRPYEPLEASAQHFAREFASAARHLLGNTASSGIFVIAPETLGDWFARALGADEGLGDYFPEGGTVRALRTSHVSPHVDTHLASPDVHLMLEALFIGQS